MKKLFFTMSALALMCSANAQTPEKKSVALTTKVTGTWCGPCGGPGWTTATAVYDEVKTSKKGIFVAMYDGDMETPATVQFYSNDPSFAGYPTFYVGSTPNASWTSATPIIADINAFAATTPVASPAANYTITGNTINVTAKAKFWSAANGEYYLASYVMEDGVMETQAGQSGTVSHHGVFRATMTANKFFGEQIVTGAVTANQEFSKTYTVNIQSGSGSTNWDKTKLVLYTAIWKKNGSKYEFVNAALSKTGGTAINDLANVDDVLIFPSPATGNEVTVSLNARQTMKLNVHITDAVGRIVYTSGDKTMSQGSNHFTIPTENLSGGIYNVVLSSENGRTTRRLSVVK